MTRDARKQVSGETVEGENAARHIGCWCIIEFVAYYRSLPGIVDKGGCQEEKKLLARDINVQAMNVIHIYTLAAQILDDKYTWQVTY